MITLKLINDFDLNKLLLLSEDELRDLLPFLVKCTEKGSCEHKEQIEDRIKFLKICNKCSDSNYVISLYRDIDFNRLKKDASSLSNHFQKQIGTGSYDALLSQSILIKDFENSSIQDKYLHILKEVITLMNLNESSLTTALKYKSEIFSSNVYFNVVTDMLCILCSEIPTHFELLRVCRAMLFVPTSTKIIKKLVLNNCVDFEAVCIKLFQVLKTSAQIKVKKQLRVLVKHVLLSLCQLNPEKASFIRSLCVDHCQLADLSVELSLEMISVYKKSNNNFLQPVDSIVQFVSGILLGNSEKVKKWFSTFLKNEAAVGSSKLFKHLNSELIKVLSSTSFNSSNDAVQMDHGIIMEEQCIRASGLIRMYCAMKSTANYVFTSEESILLLDLITSFPPKTLNGKNFCF